MTNQLKPRQKEFITAIKEAGFGTELTFAEMQEVCDSCGIYKMPPSWITHNADRKVRRGVYAIPEIDGISVSPKSTVAPAPVTTNEVIPNVVAHVGANNTPQGAVEQIVSTPTMDMTMGMTGGERQSLIPAKFSAFVKWGHYKDIKTWLNSGRYTSLFITGLSGNGKTLMVEQVCADLKRECFRVNLTCQTDEDDLLGGFRLINGSTVWQDGPVTLAMKSGAVLLLDEVDLASNKVMCLQSVLEGKGVFLKKIGQWVTPKAGFAVVGTANTKGRGDESGKFSGTGILNEAFLERFKYTYEQPYATRATERKILTKAGCTDDTFADNLTKWSEIIRKTYLEGGIDDVISTRRLVNVVEAYDVFADKKKALTLCLARFDEDTQETFLNLYDKVDADTDFNADDAGDAVASPEGNKCPF
jgi:MoxR-like ATPase